MEQRLLGSSGVSVCALGLGCMGMTETESRGGRDDMESIATIQHYLDSGGNFLDTADVYGDGANEELVGHAIRERRDGVCVATKFGIVRDPANPAAASVNGTPEYVRSACDASLKRLGVEYIDLYYLHRVDPQVPIEDTIRAMTELVAMGKVRFLGLTDASQEIVLRAAAVHTITALQSEYSLSFRNPESDGTLATCRELGIAFVASSPLGHGLLTGHIRSPHDLAPEDYRHGLPRFRGEHLVRSLELVDRIRQLARLKGCTPAQLALAWLLTQGKHVVPIPGTKHRQYVDENIAALSVSLTGAELAGVQAVFEDGALAGQRYSDEILKLTGI